MEEIRLQKLFTDCGILSRRAAEREIEAGRVLVNGVTAQTGQKIDPERDVVEYDGRVIEYRADARRHYILLNKPRGFVTTLSDEKGRRTVAELVASLGCRVYPVGRLDMDSDGLLLLTDDGDLTLRLTHPRHEIPKIYHVTLSSKPSEDQLRVLSAPMELDGYRLLPVDVKVIADNVLEMELYEGRNRQIRRMCQAVGLGIRQLTRIRIGALELGDLPLGKWRHLTEDEIRYLYERSTRGADR